MTRSAVLVLIAAVVAAALAGAIVLSAVHDDGAARPSAASRLSTGERAPEAEDHSAGDLPAVERAARRFLAGYLPLIYGKPGASIDALRSTSPRLIAALRAEGGHVTPAQAQRTPRLQRVTVVKSGAIGALATAQIKDSPSPAYPLIFHLQQTAEGWVVTRIGGP
jgi:hypothetical protein